MQKIITTLLVLLFLSISGHALAVNQDSGNQTQNNGDTTQNRETSQEQTNNPGAGTMTEEQQREEEQTQLNNATSSYTPQNQASQQYVLQVQSAVQNMIQLSYRLNNENLGSQIRTMAQNQIKSADAANQALEKAQARSDFAKFFIGANYTQLKTMKQEMDQNQLRIQELQQICSQISNAIDQTELQNQIQILEQQNTALQNQLNNEESGFSLFGWLMRLIHSY
jgi:hypothetical protein